MVDIQDYLNLSAAAKSVNTIYTNSDDLYKKYFELDPEEQDSYLRHYISKNIPYIFKEKPLVYELVIEYMADKLDIDYTDVILVGSSKVGFSLSKPPDYGKPFGIHSDLDFSVIGEDVFLDMQSEFEDWRSSYENGLIAPHNENERSYWNENKLVVAQGLKNGFIDSYKIPNRNQFPLTKKINNSAYLIFRNLRSTHHISVRGISVRVFSSWPAFAKKLKFNTESVFSKL